MIENGERTQCFERSSVFIATDEAQLFRQIHFTEDIMAASAHAYGGVAKYLARLKASLKKLRSGHRFLTSSLEENVVIGRLPYEMPPIERHVAISGIASDTGLFDKTYEIWRAHRINKVLEIYGIDHFKGLRLLELGCGHGDIGAFFAELGADVTGVDGRKRNINHARLKHWKQRNIKFEIMNLEDNFCNIGRFDLIINFGLIYHLRSVENHLRCCFEMTDDVILESVVCDSKNPRTIIYREENINIDEESLQGVGSRPSPYYIERIASESNFRIERHFTSDLNSPPQFCYDWDHEDNGCPNDDFINRRFWRLTRN